jgi:putative transposase
MHRNPARRGLVEKPEAWPWSSFVHYATGVMGTVEIESEWTARRREGNKMLVSGHSCLHPSQSTRRMGHPQRWQGRESKCRKGGPPAYCLMSNHVHLLAVPRQADALAKTLKHTHGRYATYWNAKHGSTGHVWQGRFYSCPLDRPHLWNALRYTELNPVRAGLVVEAAAWPWSSAAIHCGRAAADSWLGMHEWLEQWDAHSWREYLSAGGSESEITAVRQCTHSGRPLGTEEFVKDLEEKVMRSLAPRKGGRPPRGVEDGRQSGFVFEP